MEKLELLHFPDERLRTVAEPVDKVDDNIRKIVDQMFYTMYEEMGIGLAATQVNIHKRIIVIDISGEEKQKCVLINPEIISNSQEKDTMEEGCLSVPGFYEEIKRFRKIKVKTLNYDGGQEVIEAEDLLSVCIQHEIDHLDGKLFVDYLSNLKKDRIKKKILKMKKEGIPLKRNNTPKYKSAI